MKGYSLKVTIKGKKPTVWWRCYTAAGITFSALSMILDALTEQPGKNDFCFVISRMARIFEPGENRPLKADYYYDAADASCVYLLDYLNEAKYFSYTNGKQEYKIEIDGDIPDYMYHEPVIAKMKVPVGFDADICVKRIRGGFRFEEGDPVYMTREEMLNSSSDGVVTIPCTNKSGSRENAVQKSTRRQVAELGKMIRMVVAAQDPNPAELSKEEEITVQDQVEGQSSEDEREAEQEIREETNLSSMQDLLNSYPKSALEKIAKRLAVRKYSGMRKSTLVRELKDYLTEPVVIRNDCYFLNDEELQALEEALLSADRLYIFPESRREAFEKLCYLGYFFKQKGISGVWVPQELKEAYSRANTQAFREKRKKVQWIMKIMNTIVPTYYGEIPMNSFARLCRRTEKPKIKPEEVLGLIKLIPSSLTRSHLVGDIVCTDYYLEHPEVRKQIAMAQAGKPYHIMRQNEISEILEYGYPVKEYWHNRMFIWLREEGLEKEKARAIVSEVHQQIALAYRKDDILAFMKEVGIRIKDMAKFGKIYEGMRENSPCMDSRGFSPAMLKEEG